MYPQPQYSQLCTPLTLYIPQMSKPAQIAHVTFVTDVMRKCCCVEYN